MPHIPQLWGGFVLAALVLSPAAPRDHTPELRARFAHETSPVRKAKLMQKLGSAEFKEIEQDVTAGQFSAAAAILDRYHAEAEQCSKELDQMGADAAKKPGGFKQLQMSVREALRRLDRLISRMNADQQLPFRRDRDSLEELNSHLLQELFPSPHRKHRRIPIPLP